MQYREARAAFFQPSPPDVVEPHIVRTGGPARRLRDALEPIAMHAVWCARTNEALADGYGLDYLGAYVWGRASAMGEPAPAVVAAAFAVFEPTFIGRTYLAARARVGWSELVGTRDRTTAESLREILGDADPTGVTTALRRAIGAADPAGRPLFAGLAGREWPADPYGQLWRACDTLREHRGDSHVAAFVAAGLTGIEMNILTELWLGLPLFSYSTTRAWPRAALAAAADRLRAGGLLDGDVLSAAGHAARSAIEARTDAAQDGVVEALGGEADDVIAHLADWSGRLVAAGAFPPSVHKRAAG